MRGSKLTRQEKAIENALVRSEYIKVDRTEFKDIANAIAARRKDTVLNIRVNSQDMQSIKKMAERLNIKYQTFISEILHRIAHNKD